MTSKLAAIAFALCVSGVAFGQTETRAMPKTMLGFLKPGMRVGVSPVQGSPSVVLRTFTEDNYKVAKEFSKQLGLSMKLATSVAQSNPIVAEEVERYARRLTLTSQEKE